MTKKFLSLTLCGLLAIGTLTGCGSSGEQQESTSSKFEMLDTDLKVGMVTDAGTIDDRSFNQGSWEGIKATVKNSKYLRPSGVTDADYLESINNLYDADYRFIVTPGFKFERAVEVAQEKYPDSKFVILDGAPVNEAGEYVVGDNTVSIYFAEEQSGFLAGVAAAVELKESEFGFVGGMPIPAVQRFNWGFQQGVNYANANFNTNISIKEENVVYQGNFDDKAGGQQIAAQMYDRGVKVIFTAAGGTGIGVITEAKSRATSGDTSVFVIGVDVDQYADGIYDEATNASVILTSAMKYIDQAAHDMIVAENSGEFPGGQTLIYDAANSGIGIPAENPNLSAETLETVNSVYSKIQSGEITIANTNDGSLIK